MTILSVAFFAIMCIFFLIRYMKEKKFYDVLVIPICIYSGAVKTPLVEYLNFNTTFKITYDIAAIILVILAGPRAPPSGDSASF